MPSGRPEEWKAKQPAVGTEEFNKLMNKYVNIVYLLFQCFLLSICMR